MNDRAYIKCGNKICKTSKKTRSNTKIKNKEKKRER